jgi:PAS domain S-box-containing protein
MTISVQLSQYVLEALREDEEFVLYRGAHSNQPDSASVLLLAPASTHPVLETLKKIDHEYSLRDELDSAWAVRSLALSQQRGQMMLVLEDPGGETLDRSLSGPMEITQFLRLAFGLATALGGLHKRELIHKDVKPANVLVNPATGQVRLMGFGIASRLPRERQTPEPPEFIAGTLAYMAPEQTGRMNRSIDSRSDLYALGVTLYEMLTGTLPFMASDPMELVHCHIARPPIPPSERLTGIPGPVSAIIMKLLAKTPEERYQTAFGAASDLRHCLAEWEGHDRIGEFPLGEQDTPGRLLIPEKLYGRAFEIETLVAAFDRTVAVGRPELVLVSGYPGIGKSSVVNELHKSLVPPRGLFASGKFDQYKRDIPYATLAPAFQSLLRPLLTKNEAELSKWRDTLREAVGLNGRLIVDLVPELKLIIGKQPPVSELPPQNAQRRFQFVFRRFIGVFARPEHPLVLFLDDLQWLDAATLDLLEDLLVRSELQHLMLIGAYRENEVTAADPLTRKLEAIRNAGVPVQEVRLAPLGGEDVRQLVADVLRCEPARAVPLAELLREKTGGNPFFLSQFIAALADEGLLTFDHRAARWSWDLERIHAKGYTANVADLMAGKLSRLPVETQKGLQEFACLGNRADIATLAIVRGTPEEQVHADLSEAVHQELIERLGGAYRFVHDRVREAAYAQIPELSRAEAHLRIGRLLAAHTPPEMREELIFEIVNQLNRGVALITSRDEREQLAELDLIAGKRARNATAYASALTYLTAGRALLPEDRWERCGALAFALELHQAECEFLTGALAAAEERLSMLSSRAGRLVDSAAVTQLREDLFMTVGRSDRAVEACLDYLRHIGVQWSAHPAKEEIQREYERLWRQIGSRSIEDLVHLPLMTDAEGRATMNVLTAALAPAVMTDEDLLFLVACRMANLSLEHGNSDGSCFAYAWLADLLRARFGNYRAGFSFGKLGLDLVEQRGLRRFEARVYLMFGIASLWMQPARSGLSLVRRALDAANRLGDGTFVGYSHATLTINILAMGEPLADAQREAEAGIDFVRRFRFGLVGDMISTVLRRIKTLRGLTPEFGSFDDTEFDEGRFEQQLAEDPGLSVLAFGYWLGKLQARFLAGAYVSAVAAAVNAHRLVPTLGSFSEQAEYQLYGALARAALCTVGADADRTQHKEALAAHHRQLQEWAESCPVNLEDRAALVGAEVARIEGRTLDAEQLYEKAIRSARANGFVHMEAIANELAARFYSARGFEEIAHLYLGNARHGYLRWGADGKVRQLDEMYPHLQEEKERASAASGTIGAPVEHLDLATVLKVSQAVSGEIVLEKLVETLLRTAIEHAGAQRGLLILPHGDQLQVKAEATTGRDSVAVRTLEAPISSAAVSESVLRYVVRTQEQVIIDDASVPNSFSTDEYLREKRTRSVACLPLVKQGELIALLYLENKLTSNVFTPGRLKILEVLASQAAISLENSRLYDEIQRAEEAVRRSAKQLRDVIETMPAMAFTALPDGSTDFVNRRFSDFTGLTASDAGPHRRNTVHPEDLETHVRKWQTCLATGEPFENEVRHRGKDGQYRWFLVRGLPLRDEDGNVLKWFGTLTDIEDRKQAEERLRNENIALREEISKASMFEEIVGSSPALQGAVAQVAKVAQTDATVLILGETGTGKELLARAIHKRSRRAGGAFIRVNFAAIPPSLIASELFGHEKGAFTGALQRRLGRFEAADGGTIFLDEIGELPQEAQVALLHVLQEREIERVGSSQPIAVDVRVLAATNRDLEAAVARGTFREDLFYRLNVFPIRLPPLRERAEDIPILVEYLVGRFAKQTGKRIRNIEKSTLQLLQAYDWPGNVRELQNVIERAVVLSEGETFAIDESWLASKQNKPLHVAPVTTLADGERALIEAALTQSQGRISGPRGAAAKLGIPRQTLEWKIRTLKIDKLAFRQR